MSDFYDEKYAFDKATEVLTSLDSNGVFALRQALGVLVDYHVSTSIIKLFLSNNENFQRYTTTPRELWKELVKVRLERRQKKNKVFNFLENNNE